MIYDIDYTNCRVPDSLAYSALKLKNNLSTYTCPQF